ncbi:MAG: tetratricopeptide repeat protein, partial [Flavobacteriales bacterium]|nr:tetratricopeptide repeat protein [Flavobacteriales bacterium]
MKQLVVFLMFMFSVIFGQTQNLVDSLNIELSKVTVGDTNHIKLLLEIGEQTPILRIGYWDTIVKLSQKKLGEYPESGNEDSHATVRLLKVAVAGSLNNIGYVYQHFKGEMSNALEYYHKSLKIYEELALITNYNEFPLVWQGLADANNNIGFIHHNQGNVPSALQYYHKSLQIYEELANNAEDPAAIVSARQRIASFYNNIGYIHRNQGDAPLALEYYNKSLDIREETSDKKGMAECYNNIGFVLYKNQRDTTASLEYFHRSLKIQEEISDKRGMAYSYHNIGNIFCAMDSTEKGISYIKKGLVLAEEIGDKEGISDRLGALGIEMLHSGDLKRAKAHGERGLSIGQEIGFADQIILNAGLLSLVARKNGNYQKALEMYEMKVQYQDSMKNETTQKAAIRQQTKYEFEKAQLVKEQEEKEVARVEAEMRSRRDNLQYSIVLICLLVIGGLVAML